MPSEPGWIDATHTPLPQWWNRNDVPAFVGRGAEVAVVERAWADAQRGQRQVVMLLGDPGAGKSRLAAELCREFVAGPAVVLLGACLPDAPVAYEPFVEPVAAMLSAVSAARGGGQQPHALEALEALTPRARERGLSSQVTLAEDAFEAVVSLLEAAAAEQPVVLVVEDLHWATPTTVALMAWIVRRLTSARVLILVTSRFAPPDRAEHVMATLASLARESGVHRIQLSGLAPEEVAQFLTAEGVATGPDAAGLAHRFHQETHGNPFLLQEICRELRSCGRSPEVPGSQPMVPQTVRDIFASRLQEFAPEQRGVIELAAVIGESVSISTLDVATRSDAATLPAVDLALTLGVLVAEPATSSFRFPHALARQSVLDGIPAVRLAAHHARAAELLEARSGQSLAEIQQLAHHYRNAYGQIDKARECLVRAAYLAARSLAWWEAARLFEQAAELSDGPLERHRLLLLAVDCLQTADHIDDAHALAKQVARDATDPAVRLEAATLLERVATLKGGNPEAVRLLVQVLRETPPDPQRLSDLKYLKALAGLSRGLAQVGDSTDMQAAVELQSGLLTHVRGLGNPAGLSYVLASGLPAAFGRPRLARELLARARELSRLSRGTDWSDMLGASAFFLALLGFRTGDPNDVRAAVIDYELATQHGYPLFVYWPLAIEGANRFHRGDFAGSEEIAHQMQAMVTDIYGQERMGHLGIQLFFTRRETCRLGPLAALLSGDEDVRGRWAPGLLGVYTALRMREPAARLLAQMADDGALHANSRSEYMPTALAFLVEAALLLQDAEMLAKLRPMVAEHTGLNLVSDQFIAHHGSADRYLGMIDSHLAQGDPLELFDAAADLDVRSGSVVHLGLTLVARARHLAKVAGPHTPAVASALEQAREVATPIGHTRVLRAAAALAPDQPKRHLIVAERSGLTAREMEVLGLLAHGASNQEIARSLVISQNTAANHIRSILFKTGTSNRTQAAMLAVSRGWVAPVAAVPQGSPT